MEGAVKGEAAVGEAFNCATSSLVTYDELVKLCAGAAGVDANMSALESWTYGGTGYVLSAALLRAIGRGAYYRAERRVHPPLVGRVHHRLREHTPSEPVLSRLCLGFGARGGGRMDTA